MRTEDMTIMDWNPKVSDHWVFNLEKRDDCKFLHATFHDNALIPPSILKDILSYNPNVSENVRQNKADDYLWKVYGLGLRASPKGLIFQNVTWIDTFPTDIEEIIYGMDFGYTNSPTAIVKVGRNGKNLYIQKLFYTPTDNAADLAAAIKVLDIKGSIWADSADPGLITDLNNKGLNVYAVRKFADSIRYGIDLIKQHHIHLVRDPDLRREQENYHWREIGGISLNEPIDDFNHIWDGCRYAVLMNFRRE